MAPEWLSQYKEPRTEIRFIKGGYYKYAVSYKYDPSIKRTRKVSGDLLGKITEHGGFAPSSKNTLRSKAVFRHSDIKEYGVYLLFVELLKEELVSLEKVFEPGILHHLLIAAMFRWSCQSPIKRMPLYHERNFCSEQWMGKGISDKSMSASLEKVGFDREKVVSWMRGNMRKPNQKFILMDSTNTFSYSEKLHINEVGYNPQHQYDPQINLMYLFSAELQQPAYYRLVPGNIREVKAMKLCVEESSLQQVVLIADKGFYSKDNILALEQEKLDYIIPLRRNNALIDYAPLQKANFKKGMEGYFMHEKKVIWYYDYAKDGQQVITFLDEQARVNEQADYISRIQSHPEKYNQQQLMDKQAEFGTLTLVYKLAESAAPADIYATYKIRGEIETMFDAYKTTLKADRTFMQNRMVLEGWLMANFIAMIAYYKLYYKLKKQKLLKKYSPKDIIEIGKGIFKLKVNNEWKSAEITVKNKDLLKKLGIDYLT